MISQKHANPFVDALHCYTCCVDMKFRTIYSVYIFFIYFILEYISSILNNAGAQRNSTNKWKKSQINNKKNFKWIFFPFSFKITWHGHEICFKSRLFNSAIVKESEQRRKAKKIPKHETDTHTRNNEYNNNEVELSFK